MQNTAVKCLLKFFENLPQRKSINLETVLIAVKGAVDVERMIFQAIGDEIEKQSREHITISGKRFVGISLAEVHRILTNYGYENKPPF